MLTAGLWDFFQSFPRHCLPQAQAHLRASMAFISSISPPPVLRLLSGLGAEGPPEASSCWRNYKEKGALCGGLLAGPHQPSCDPPPVPHNSGLIPLFHGAPSSPC